MEVGRLRRRINGHIQGSRREGQRLLSWRTYAKRYPAGMLAAAFGVGMAASAGLKGPKLLRSICAMLIRGGTGAVGRGVKDELARFWEESSPHRDSDGRNRKDAHSGANDG